MKTTKITITNLNSWYGNRQVLFDIDLEIHEKKITALLGLSGSGKSTLLRCMNRMHECIPNTKTTGSILYTQQNIYAQNSDVVDVRRNIGMVFQKPNPFPFSIFDNVAYGIRLQNNKSHYEIEHLVEESLKKADIWEEVKDRLHVSALQLSGGQQQRLCIARALAIHPDVLLLDEPCSALDPIATRKIEELLQKLKNEMTLVLVTHNIHQARRISDTVVFLYDGKIVEHAPTKQFFEKPQHDITKAYLSGEIG